MILCQYNFFLCTKSSVGIICRCFGCLYMIPQFEITKKGNMQWHIVQALRDCITAEWTHCIVV